MVTKKSRCVIGVDSNIKAVKSALFNNKIEQPRQNSDLPEVYPFKKYYRGKNQNCGMFWMLNADDGDLKLSSCGQFSCQRCRPKKIAGLREDLLRECKENALLNRLDMTLMGKEFRSKVTAEESYIYHNEKFENIIRAMRRKHGDVNYISLRRSQKDGYCHSHTFMDVWIEPEWMEKKARGHDVGWCRLRHGSVEQMVKYVASHFSSNPAKLGEFCIPEGKKHVTTSQNIKLSDFQPSGEWKKVDPRDITRLTKKNEYEAIRPVYEYYTGIAEVPIEPFFGAFCQMTDEKVFDFQRVM